MEEGGGPLGFSNLGRPCRSLAGCRRYRDGIVVRSETSDGLWTYGKEDLSLSPLILPSPRPYRARPSMATGGPLPLLLSPLSLSLSFLSLPPRWSLCRFLSESNWFTTGVVWHGLNCSVRDGLENLVSNSSSVKL